MAEMQTDDISDILAEAPSAAAPTMGAASETAVDDISDILNEAPSIDDLTGEDIPEAFAGRTPETAMNKTPLTALDRFKMSMGNEAGNLEYLKKRFDGVQPILDAEGKPTKELAVLQNGKWSRVDPVNGDIRDPWEMAKSYAQNPAELVGDIADLGPIGLGAGLAAAIPVAAVGGSAALTAGAVGLATAAARTSLGRVVGTYDATPAEQAWDIGFETLLNAGGQKIMMGVKPTASKVADMLEPLAKRFADTVDTVTPDAIKTIGKAAVDTPKAILKKIFAGYSVGEDNFDTMVQHTTQVKSLMKMMDAKAGGNSAIYHDEVTRHQLESVKGIAQNSRNVLSQIYGSMRNKIVDKVPDNFTMNFDDVLQGSYSDAVSKNLGRIVVGDKSMVGAEAAEYMAKNGMKNARFELLPQNEMAKMIRAGTDLGDDLGVLASDREAYSMVRDYYRSLSTFSQGADRTGKAGAKALLDFKKTAGELSWSFANKEKAQALPGVKRIIDNSRASMDNSVRKSLDKWGLGASFDDLNSTYSKLNKEFSPLLTASERYAKSGDTKVFEGLLSSFLARPGKQSSKRFAVDHAIAAAEANGLKMLSTKLAKEKTSIQIGEAAKAFNPIKNGQIKADALGAGQAGMAIFAAGSMNPALLAGIAGVQMLRSPMTAKTAVGVTQGLFKGQQFLAQQTPKALDAFFSNPQALQTFTNAVVQSPLIREQTNQALMSKMQGQ